MPQRNVIRSSRPATFWILAVIAVLLLVGILFSGLVLLPRFQSEQAAARHYQAGITFESVEDWLAAESEYEHVITFNAGYKDVQAKLAGVKARLVEVQNVATADAVAEAEQAQVAATNVALSAQATMMAAPTITAEALDARYQRALGLINIQQWIEAQVELRAVFDVDPNFKNVQEELSKVNAQIARLTPTVTPTLIATATPTATQMPTTIKLEPRSAISFQNEGTRETDDTGIVSDKDGFWAPSLTGGVTQDYFANGWGDPYFDALSLEFDVGDRSYRDFDATLRAFVQYGEYGSYPGGDSRWNHYVALPGRQNPDYQDALPQDVPLAEQFDYSAGKWIEIRLTPKFWSEEEIWVTLRLWNARVDAIELLLTSKQQ